MVVKLIKMLWNESGIIHVYDNLFVVWCAEGIWAWSASANKCIDCIRIFKYRSISNKMVCHFVASFIKWCVLKYMLCDDAYMNAMCCIFFRQKYWKAHAWHLLYSHWLRLPMFQLYSVTLAVTKQDIHIKNLRKACVPLLTRRESLVEQAGIPSISIVYLRHRVVYPSSIFELAIICLFMFAVELVQSFYILNLIHYIREDSSLSFVSCYFI